MGPLPRAVDSRLPVLDTENEPVLCSVRWHGAVCDKKVPTSHDLLAPCVLHLGLAFHELMGEGLGQLEQYVGCLLGARGQRGVKVTFNSCI